MLELVANTVVFGAVVVAGVAVNRRVNPPEKLVTLPLSLQLLAAGVAIAPIVLLHDGLAAGPIDGIVTSFAVSVVLWIALPAALWRMTDGDPGDTGLRG